MCQAPAPTDSARHMACPSLWSCLQGAFWRGPSLWSSNSSLSQLSELLASAFHDFPPRELVSLFSLCVCPWLSLLPITVHPQVRRWQGFIISSLTWLPFHKLDQWPSSYLLAPLARNAHHCHSIFMRTQGGGGSRRLGRYFCTAFSALFIPYM